MRYSDISDFVTSKLQALGYGQDGGPAMPLIDPGPITVARLQSKSPNAMLFVVLGNGIGLAKEGLFHMPFITVRAIGLQNNFAYAETLAYDVDNTLLAVDSNTDMGGARVLYITRTGGAPQLVDFDAGDRYHFQATYITETKR